MCGCVHHSVPYSVKYANRKDNTVYAQAPRIRITNCRGNALENFGKKNTSGISRSIIPVRRQSVLKSCPSILYCAAVRYDKISCLPLLNNSSDTSATHRIQSCKIKTLISLLRNNAYIILLRLKAYAYTLY